jgi:hypothetical protein
MRWFGSGTACQMLRKSRAQPENSLTHPLGRPALSEVTCHCNFVGSNKNAGPVVQRI